MSYDFYIEKVAELDRYIQGIEKINSEILRAPSGENKKQIRKQLKNLTNSFCSTLDGQVSSEHIKSKIMHALFSARRSVGEVLKDIYQNKLSLTGQQFPQTCEAIDVTQYPAYTLFLQFKFRLAKPYISRDDEIFYICENPIRKDKVLKIPMISSSTWKGNMRFAAHMVQPDSPDSVSITRLFGNEKEASSDFHQGFVWFYDTFFQRISLEVINPHDREKKAGTTPITIEAVPSGEEGYFKLLYCPFDLMGCHDARRVKEEVSADLYLLSEALRLMMLEYGFSAKKTAGYGIIRSKVREAIIRMRGLQPQRFSTTEVLFEDLMEELKRLAGSLKNE